MLVLSHVTKNPTRIIPDVPIGRSVESLRELEEKIGIDLGIEEEVPASQKGAKL